MRKYDNYNITNVLAAKTENDENLVLDDLFVPVTLDEKESERLYSEPYSYWKSVFRVFFKKPSAIIAITSLIIFLLAIIIIPFFCPAEWVNAKTGCMYFNMDKDHIYLKPSAAHLFGTDEVGRDLFFLVFKGARKSLVLALISSGINVVIGTVFGLIWGFFRKLDPIFVEFYNLISNIPGLLIYLLLAQIFTKAFPRVNPETRLIVALTLVGWLGLARFIRNQVLIITNREYNLASKALGTPAHRIMSRNLLPYILAVIITEASLIIPGMISSEVTMSYFGVGLPTTSESIGAVLKRGTNDFIQHPWVLLAPSFILAWVIFTFFLLGLAMSDALDPRKHR